MRGITLNTSEVANMLAVSTSTVKRWVKQLDLELGRNERGHLQFQEGDIEVLRLFKAQANQGNFPQEMEQQAEKPVRKGTFKGMKKESTLMEQAVVKEQETECHFENSPKLIESVTESQQFSKDQSMKDPSIENIKMKIEHLNKRIDGKADSVTSYQLLQHRSEIEDLQNLVNLLSNQIKSLEIEIKNLKSKTMQDLPLMFDQPRTIKKPKKKNIISSFFGF
jgi:chromosome-anchoring protein RacA